MTKKTNGKTKGGKKVPLTAEQKAGYMAANDATAIKAFNDAGFADVKPRVNVLTYKKFIETGRKVRAGEKSTKVGPFALFHVSQTDAIAAA